MSDSIEKLQTLTRAELALAHIKLQLLIKRSVLQAFAGLVGLAGLAMIDVAVYHALIPRFGEAVAALLIALGNGVIAAIIFAVAGKVGKNDGEERLAIQLRDHAAADVNQDVEQLKYEVAEITAGVRQVRSSLSAASALASLPLALIGPALGNLVKRRKRR